MKKITIRDIYWDKFDVGGMAMGDLIRAMQNTLPADKRKEFQEMAIIKYTVLAIEQILNEDNSLSDIDLELPSSYIETQNG